MPKTRPKPLIDACEMLNDTSATRQVRACTVSAIRGDARGIGPRCDVAPTTVYCSERVRITNVKRAKAGAVSLHDLAGGAI